MWRAILIILAIFFASSCQNTIYFDPNPRALRVDRDTGEVYLLTRDAERIYQGAEFFRHACMSEDKWIELFEILQDAGAEKQANLILRQLNFGD